MSLFEIDQAANAQMLEVAVEEFGSIVSKTDGTERLENVLSLCLALINQSEAQPESSSEEARAPLRRVVEMTREWLPSYTTEASPLGNARLHLLLAQALQVLSEKPYEAAGLTEAQEAYDVAIKGLSANKDPGGLLINAKAGLAAVYQVRGEADGDADLLREAVKRFREVVDLSRGADRTIEEAGPLENLAGCLVALAKVVDAGEAEIVYQEARSLLERVIGIHQHLGDEQGESASRHSLEEIDQASGGLAGG